MSNSLAPLSGNSHTSRHEAASAYSNPTTLVPQRMSPLAIIQFATFEQL